MSFGERRTRMSAISLKAETFIKKLYFTFKNLVNCIGPLTALTFLSALLRGAEKAFWTTVLIIWHCLAHRLELAVTILEKTMVK